jgi:ClpP class serine protease
LVKDLEERVAQARRETEDSRKEAQEQLERTRREFEANESRYRQTHLADKENTFKECERLV